MAFPVGARTTGEFITASIWNADIKDNINALYGYLFSAGSSTTLLFGGGFELTGRATPGVSTAGNGRVYFDSTTKKFQVSEDGAAYKGLGASQSYLPTLLDAGPSSVVETAILSFIVPANQWADGELISVILTSVGKNNKGSAGTPVVKVNVGAGAQVALATLDAWPDNATTYNFERGFLLQRQGATVNIITPPSSRSAPITIWTDALSLTHIVGTSTPANFTTAITVALKITLDASHANYFWKLLTGGCAQVTHAKS
jgi:hypothetical protein